MTEEDLNVTEAAKRLGVHPNTLRRWVDAGLIEAIVLPDGGFRPSVIDEIRRTMESSVSLKNPLGRASALVE